MPRCSLLARATLVLALAVPARAALTPPGVNIRWDACYDDSGAANKLFACDTNTGSASLVLSLVMDAVMDSVSGMEIRVEFWSASASLPDWWQFKNIGTCRQSSLSFSTILPPAAVNCSDWASGNAAGGIGSYTVSQFGPNMATVLVAEAVPPTALASLDPGTEYFLCRLTINHLKTVGTPSCTGCDVPVCVVFSAVNVDTPILANNRRFWTGANNVASQLANWQNGSPVNPFIGGSTMTGGPRTTLEGCVLSSTPTRNSTWGAVKALYR
jgi:hypothetical protein